MRRLGKILFWIIGLTIGAAALVVGAFFLTPSSVIAGQADAWARERLGRGLAVAGPIERRLYPTLGVTLQGVALENAAWAGPEPLLEAEGLSFDLDPLALFSGRFKVVDARLQRPALRLTVDRDGAQNWRLGPPPKPPAPGEELQSVDVTMDAANLEAPERETGSEPEAERDLFAWFQLAAAALVDGSVIIENRRAGRRTEIGRIELRVGGAAPAATAAPAVEGTRFEGTGLVNGRPVELNGRIAGLAGGEGVRRVAEMRLAGAGAAFDFEGAVATDPAAPSAEGRVDLSLSEDLDLTDWLRSALPAELAPLEGIAADGRLAASLDRLDLALQGTAGFNGQTTALTIIGGAGDGWLSGGAADVEATLANGFFDAGYDGEIGRTAEGGLTLEGAFRLAAPDFIAFAKWAWPDTPDPLLESVDLEGVALINDAQARVDTAGLIGFNQRSVSLGLEAAGPRGWRTGAPIGISFDAGAEALFTAAADLTFQFVDGVSPKLEGEIDAKTDDWAAFRAWTGAAPAERDYGAVSLKTELLVDEASLDLDRAALTVGSVVTEGRGFVNFEGERPLFSLALAGGPLDLTPFIYRDGDAPGGQSPERLERLAASDGAPIVAPAERPEGWSTTPFPLDFLEAADGEAVLRLEGVTAGALTFERTRLRARLREGRLDLNLIELFLYGGRAQGVASLEQSGAGLGVRADIGATAVGLQPFLEALGRPDWARGLVTLDVEATAAGADLAETIESLNGDGDVEVSNGALLAIDFAELALDGKLSALGAKQPEPGVTPFDRAAAAYTIREGVLRFDQAGVQGDVIRAEAVGLVDIAERALDMTVTPTGFGEISLFGIDRAIGSAFPIRIQGPWGALDVGLDREGEFRAPFAGAEASGG